MSKSHFISSHRKLSIGEKVTQLIDGRRAILQVSGVFKDVDKGPSIYKCKNLGYMNFNSGEGDE